MSFIDEFLYIVIRKSQSVFKQLNSLIVFCIFSLESSAVNRVFKNPNESAKTRLSW